MFVRSYLFCAGEFVGEIACKNVSVIVFVRAYETCLICCVCVCVCILLSVSGPYVQTG